jgi:chemotaxis protein CheY-P-specific phosphatase CheC
METLSKPEIDFAEKLIRKGYLRAADSFSSIVMQPVGITGATLAQDAQLDDIVQMIIKHDEPIILITDIIGDIRGKGYLVLTQAEGRQLYQLCLAAFSDTTSKQLSEESVLKEVDNILSAAMIAEFSDALGLSIFGDVPVLINDAQLAKFDLGSDGWGSNSLLTTTSFTFNGHEKLKPLFLWKLNDDFLMHVKKIAALQ